MKALSVISVLLLACSLSLAETRQPYYGLLVHVGDVELGVYPPSGDSVIVSVYLESVLDWVGALDVWLSLGHNEVFRWDTISTLGTAIEDWELEEASVIGLQLHVVANGYIVGGTPIPPGMGLHLLMRLIAKVREDRLDPDGTVVDSMCDSPYYELYGVTPIYIDSVQFWTGDGAELIGEVIMNDGEITLDCSNCGDLIIGDADASGYMDIDDVVYLIAYIFSGGLSPDPYESGDADCSCDVDIDDVVYLIAYIFTGGPSPQCTCDEWIDNCGPLH